MVINVASFRSISLCWRVLGIFIWLDLVLCNQLSQIVEWTPIPVLGWILNVLIHRCGSIKIDACDIFVRRFLFSLSAVCLLFFADYCLQARLMQGFYGGQFLLFYFRCCFVDCLHEDIVDGEQILTIAPFDFGLWAVPWIIGMLLFATSPSKSEEIFPFFLGGRPALNFSAYLVFFVFFIKINCDIAFFALFAKTKKMSDWGVIGCRNAALSLWVIRAPLCIKVRSGNIFNGSFMLLRWRVYWWVGLLFLINFR